MGGGLAFVLLIIGLLYVGIHSLIDNAVDSRNRCEAARRANIDAERRSHWLARTTDRALEERLKDRIRQNDEELYEELLATQGQYFDKKWWAPRSPSRFYFKGATMFPPKIEGAISAMPSQSWMALRILMANRGKLVYHDADLGILFGGVNTIGHEQYVAERDFLCRLNEKLRSVGICEKMYIETVPCSYFQFPEEERPYAATRLLWRPVIPDHRLEFCERRRAEYERRLY